ncbi:G-type lectin S-receptor-like serine/threonine-protein kinase LECRK1 isoform X2 [Salvia splendens]|uniref:G-type lectin S-receptor-like serine/threonine-protein kinase LECRK1 isoform X2 n=1 Tax=Salvia splendens TaxID=180675 RepID=UPI001C270A7F|nr:G-type lectin S-receptor-like serine/threonine-protein kinase LECRK1 isoform X2 [Salvia splendens]
MASCRLLLLIINIIIISTTVKGQESSNRNVTLGSSIVANSNSTWTSPSGEFAFGFREVSPGTFLLAVWFDQIPDKTLVWSANRDEPVPAGSTVQLSADGTLELVNQTGSQVWAIPARPGTVAYAAMLDNGNLVLASNASAILWQSFDFSTDTLLPTQADGNLVLVTRSYPSDENVNAYWSSDTRDAGFQLIFNNSGVINLIRQNGTLLRPLFGSGSLAGQFYQRLVLEHDGVLRHYVYDDSLQPSGWSVRNFEPSNICHAIREDDMGGGPCGFNAYCTIKPDGRSTCHCPSGYYSRGGFSGCAPEFVQHRCDLQQAQDAHSFTFNEMSGVNWPFKDYAIFRDVEEAWCRQSCISDCLCALVIYSGRVCWMKAHPFSNGREQEAKALIKVRINNTFTSNPHTPPSGRESSKRSSITVTILSALLGCSVLLFLLLSFFFVFYLKRGKTTMVEQRSRVQPAGVSTISSFSFKEVEEATDGFNEELGRGACSIVYRGTLKTDGKIVAVKKLHKVFEQADDEFKAEVSSISRTNHKNLVQLLGYCDEGQNRILVYEFMTNGSLATFLFQKSVRPSWHKRVQIAFAIARGICYLHEDCSVPIIHCDIKPQNVLLDESFAPKIADFGLAKLLKADQTRTMTGIRGTKGYVAPEWFRNMPITVKVDVYSFGIMLLELMCCRRSYEADVEDEGEAVLADWAYDCYQQGALDLLVAGDEEARSDMKTLEIYVKTAIWCIQEDPTLRPHMNIVMHMLQGSMQVPTPPDPTAFIH